MLARILVLLLVFGLAIWGLSVLYSTPPVVCSICQREMHPGTACSVELRSGDVLQLCCPRCCLQFQKSREDIVSVTVPDFRTLKQLDAAAAFYVEGSSVHPCCSGEEIRKDQSGGAFEKAWDRCLPSLVAFEAPEEAASFSQAKGGRILTYSQVAVELSEP